METTHDQRVERLVEMIGLEVSFSKEQYSRLKLFARFHDIGKSQIPSSILYKPGPLTNDEMNIMKRHSELGKELAEKLALVSEFILKHHEHWDGNGYPLGLKGNEIPVECRILSILDAYDAMTHDRPYQKAISHEKAIQKIKDCSGTQFDPDLVEMLCSLMEKAAEQAG
jgi:HD-GYP domain-containing protein (c-di-GMP phosphodiesterase class II)